MNETLPKLTQKTARTILAGLGFTLKATAGEFRIRAKGTTADYFTDDLQDAVDTARSLSFNRDSAHTVPVMERPVAERVVEGQYWIQEQAPAGNFFDSIGFPVGHPKEQAVEQLRSWQASFPNRVCRLISRTDTFIVA